ncbi:MAG: hypothetical protein WKF33_04305 [Thermoleophilaceae bacterium]
MPDFRSKPMDSAEGKGFARRAWAAYAETVNRLTAPAVQPLAKKVTAPAAVDLIGFWLVWHLHGGYEGLRELGMSRASIYRRIKLFRTSYGAHPDEYELPGVKIDVAEYAAGARSKSHS